jgi:ribosomal-protein-alanine N-acetyltransferase
LALRSSFWGKGYAKEAANAALDFAFNQLKLEKVVSFTTLENKKSQRLMQR